MRGGGSGGHIDAVEVLIMHGGGSSEVQKASRCGGLTNCRSKKMISF